MAVVAERPPVLNIKFVILLTCVCEYISRNMWQQKGCSGYMDPHTDRFPFVGVGKQTLRFDLFRHRVFILRTSPYQSFSVFGRRLAPLPPSPHRLWLDLVLFVTFIEGEFLVHRNLITTNSNLSKWSSSWSTIKLLVSFFICPLV